MAERLKYTGKLDIESGYAAVRTPVIKNVENRLALAEIVKAVLDEQDKDGFWISNEIISNRAFVRNATILLTYLHDISPNTYIK